MIVKGTKQLGSFRRGINLYVPKITDIATTAGLYGTRYVGYFSDNVNWFSTATKQGETNQLTQINSFTSNADQYSWEWIGYFKALTTETYTFYTYSDDASYLWIGDIAKNGYTTANSTVNNGGEHGEQEASGSISLIAGKKYPIRIQFGENGGGDVITVSFSTPTISKTTNGLNYYFHNPNISQPEQTIWKVAVFGAGNSEFNGEYIWDGTTLVNGKPTYIGPSPYGGDNAYISWDSDNNIWNLNFDVDIIYQSVNLVTWTRPSGGGDDPAPSSVLSYNQNSYIQTIQIDVTPDLEGFNFDGVYTTSNLGITYEKAGDGTTYSIYKSNNLWFLNEQNDIGDLIENQPNLFNMHNNNYNANTTNITYSA